VVDQAGDFTDDQPHGSLFSYKPSYVQAMEGTLTMNRWRRLWAMILAVGMLWWLSTTWAMALQVGDHVPTFSLPGTTAEQVKLDDYLGRQHIVLFFYIAAFGRA
jgi:hypothetical protein